MRKAQAIVSFEWPAEKPRQGPSRALNRILVEDGYKEPGSHVGSPLWMWGTVDAFHSTPYALESVREFLLQKRAIKIPGIDARRGWMYTKQLALNALCMCVWGDLKVVLRDGMPYEKEVKERAERILIDMLHSGDKKLIAMLEEMLEKLLNRTKRAESGGEPKGQILRRERKNVEDFATACRYHLSRGECDFCEPSFERGKQMLESTVGSANGLADVMLELQEDPRKVKDVAAVLFQTVDVTKPPMPEQLRKDAAWVVIVSTAFDPVAVYDVEGKENRGLSRMAMEELMNGMQKTENIGRFEGRIRLQRTVDLSTLFAIDDVCKELTVKGGLAHKENTPLGKAVREIKRECVDILGKEMPSG